MNLPPDKLELRINKFQQFIDIKEYDSVIAKLIQKINGLNIRDVDLSSGLEQSKLQDVGGIYFICIRTNCPSGSRKVLVFDLMHELGHYLDPDKLTVANQHDEALQRGREIRAWALADVEFATYHEVATDMPEYTDYKRKCLLSYGITL